MNVLIIQQYDFFYMSEKVKMLEHLTYLQFHIKIDF